MGAFICSNENTRKQVKMVFAQIMVRTKYNVGLNETFNVQFNDIVYHIKIVEYSQGALQIIILGLNDE